MAEISEAGEGVSGKTTLSLLLLTMLLSQLFRKEEIVALEGVL